VTKQDDSDLVICRCEEVTKGEILNAVKMGASTMWQVRRLTRSGLGLCQGRSCERIAARIVAGELGKPLEQVLRPSYRPPVQPVAIEVLASGERVKLE
jgi:NAD(P)H-nitrite reductase large subunit